MRDEGCTKRWLERAHKLRCDFVARKDGRAVRARVELYRAGRAIDIQPIRIRSDFTVY